MRRPDGDHGVGGEHEAPALPTAAGLGARQALREQRAAARRGAGVSSMSGETTRSGMTPICASSASRRGLAEARTSLGLHAGRAHLKRNVIRPLVRS